MPVAKFYVEGLTVLSNGDPCSIILSQVNTCVDYNFNLLIIDKDFFESRPFCDPRSRPTSAICGRDIFDFVWSREWTADDVK
jgi:hypothetical protein